ncbi:hypothetical protein HY932_02915 [Candidatus Falkowbacteria bacterium]|nr:hypothetical protein [Candidatus Falkowbacteria bacterium]
MSIVEAMNVANAATSSFLPNAFFERRHVLVVVLHEFEHHSPRVKVDVHASETPAGKVLTISSASNPNNQFAHAIPLRFC